MGTAGYGIIRRYSLFRCLYGARWITKHRRAKQCGSEADWSAPPWTTFRQIPAVLSAGGSILHAPDANVKPLTVVARSIVIEHDTRCKSACANK
jgi:hypothetical protein